MLKVSEYRIYPNEEQKILLEKHFGCVRWIYNWGLEQKIKSWKETGKYLSEFTLSGEIPKLKKQEETKWLGEVTAQSLQQSLYHLEQAYIRFFRKKNGFPKFKSKHDNRKSYSIPQRVKLDFETSEIHLPKFKTPIKMRIDRIFKGKIKTCTIKKSPTNKYFVSIMVEDGKELPTKRPMNNFLGIDLGLKDFLTTSNGDKFSNPKFGKELEIKLSKEQRELSHKKRGSNNYKKQRIKVAKVYEKITNRRKDFLHKLSSKLVYENQVDVICMEDLNIVKMLKNKNLSKMISDVSWSEFVRQIKYKCDWKGITFHQIGRFDASSKICSDCGWIKKYLKLIDREWVCEECGSIHDRDINAAINIRDIIKSRVGSIQTSEKKTSVEISMMDDCVSKHLKSQVSKKQKVNKILKEIYRYDHNM